jgi:hypothetical protein
MRGGIFLLNAVEEVFKFANIESNKVNVQLHYVSHHAKASICKCARNYDFTN